jgi:hypothetical protein
LRQVRHRRGSAVAFIAALVLVLQSFLSASASGAFAATPLLDAFGNPLCITSVDRDGSPPTHDHSKLTDCCAFGCSMVSPLFAAAPGDDIGLSSPLASDDIRYELIQSFHIRAPDHDPGSPRAPPMTV